MTKFSLSKTEGFKKKKATKSMFFFGFISFLFLLVLGIFYSEFLNIFSSGKTSPKDYIIAISFSLLCQSLFETFKFYHLRTKVFSFVESKLNLRWFIFLIFEVIFSINLKGWKSLSDLNFLDFIVEIFPLLSILGSISITILVIWDSTKYFRGLGKK